MGACFWTDFVGCAEDCDAAGVAHPLYVNQDGYLCTYTDFTGSYPPTSWPYADTSSIDLATLTLQNVTAYPFTPTGWGVGARALSVPAIFGETGAVNADMVEEIGAASGASWSPIAAFPAVGAPQDITSQCGNDPTRRLFPVETGAWYGSGWWVMVVTLVGPDGAQWKTASARRYSEQ